MKVSLIKDFKKGDCDEESNFENKLVTEKQLENYLNKGWEMVQTVNNKILVRKRT